MALILFVKCTTVGHYMQIYSKADQFACHILVYLFLQISCALLFLGIAFIFKEVFKYLTYLDI